MICANCTQDAVWMDDAPGAAPLYYCDGCKPQGGNFAEIQYALFTLEAPAKKAASSK